MHSEEATGTGCPKPLSDGAVRKGAKKLVDNYSSLTRFHD
jgi:hypothetical protein